MGFKVGDRVVVKSDYCGAATKGLFGTIVTVDKHAASCGVELDVDFYAVGDPTSKCGHSCGGKAKNNRGWYIANSELSLIEDPLKAFIEEVAAEKKEVAKRKPITIPKSKLSAIDIIKCHIASVTYPHASIDSNGVLSFYKEKPKAISYFETMKVKR